MSQNLRHSGALISENEDFLLNEDFQEIRFLTSAGGINARCVAGWATHLGYLVGGKGGGGSLLGSGERGGTLTYW